MIKVTVLNSAATGSKLAVIRRKLDFGTNQEFFRTVQLSDFQERALEYIQSITPVGKNTDYYESLGVKAPTRAQMALRDSWRVKRVTTDKAVGFEITSLLERSGKRGWAKLLSIEYGNQPGFYIAKRAFNFYSTEYRRWVHIQAGEKVNRPSREGLHLTQKTSEYIQSVLLPEIKSKVSSIVRSRMDKL
jgi:hypothetical protein